jgi:hypothetical protein
VDAKAVGLFSNQVLCVGDERSDEIEFLGPELTAAVEIDVLPMGSMELFYEGIEEPIEGFRLE